jgi:hypothetical protein
MLATLIGRQKIEMLISMTMMVCSMLSGVQQGIQLQSPLLLKTAIASSRSSPLRVDLNHVKLSMLFMMQIIGIRNSPYKNTFLGQNTLTFTMTQNMLNQTSNNAL